MRLSGGRCCRIRRELSEMPAKRVMNKIKNGDPVRCNHKIIKGDLDISSLDLPKEKGKFLISSIIQIKNSRINGYVNFANVIFKNDFYKDVDFTNTSFCGHADFNMTSFCQGACFIDTHFCKKVTFKEAKFDSVVFTGAKFDGYADLRKAKFHKTAILDGIQFNNYANFVEACFNTIASFHWACFNDYANFSGARFKEKANFNRVRFREDADFRGVIFEKEFSLKESSFERFYVDWENIKGRLTYDGAIYLSLIKNFKNLEFFEDSDNCYYQYRRLATQKNYEEWYSSPNKYVDLFVNICEEIASYPKIVYTDLKWLCNTSPPLTWIYRFNWSKLCDQLSWISCGYGVRVTPIILWMVGLSLFFAFVYYISNGIMQTGISETTMKALNPTSISIFDSFYFSVMAMIGKPLPGFYPIGGWRYVVMTESFTGYLLLALFVVVLVRKLIR